MLEYETAEMAEEAQQRADGLALGGSHLRVSFCAPGPPGRSMLAALIAAQATVSVCLGRVPPGRGGGVRGASPPPWESQGASWALGVRGRGEPASPWPGGALSRSSVSLYRPSTGAKGSCPSPTSCSCSTTWGPPPPSSCC